MLGDDDETPWFSVLESLSEDSSFDSSESGYSVMRDKLWFWLDISKYDKFNTWIRN